MEELISRLYPLRRTLVSDDMDKAISIITDHVKDIGIPPEDIHLHKFKSGTEASTWIIPKKHVLRDYSLVQIEDKKKETIISKKDMPLSVIEYSEPIDKVMPWTELKDHLFFSEKRPKTIPFVYNFFYRPNWGFGIPKVKYDKLNKKAMFHAIIDSEKVDGELKCLEVVIPGESAESILVMSNICHPYQVNDSLSGAINALMLIKYFSKRKNRYTLRFGFWPETIGAHAYFSKMESVKHIFKYAIFTEMLGINENHALQLSRQEDSLADRVAKFVLKNEEFRVGRYTTIARNDERVSNGVNLDIPTISLTRQPFYEYHTSDDNPLTTIIGKITESNEVTKEIIKIIDENGALVNPSFLGQPFLTRFNMFVDFKKDPKNPNKLNKNKIMEDVFSYSDGKASLFDIAEKFDYPWDIVKEIADKLVENKLFEFKG
jgi:aminopeptidase-like protein